MDTTRIYHPKLNRAKLSLTEYEFIKNEVAKTIRDDPQYRLGQAWFNELVAHIPEFGWIRATNLDPFYRDEVLLDLFFHILDEEAYASWTHSKEYEVLYSAFAKEHPAKPVDTSGSELSDFVDAELVGDRMPDDWEDQVAAYTEEERIRLDKEAEEVRRKDEENEKAINEKYRIYNLPADGFYKIQLHETSYDPHMKLYRYLDVYGVVQYADHPQVMCSANSVVAMMWAEDNDAVWLWKKPFGRTHEGWKLEWSNPNNPTEVIEIEPIAMENETYITDCEPESTGTGLTYSGDYKPVSKETTNVRFNIATTRDPIESVNLLKEIADMLSTIKDIRIRNIEVSQW
jgi:hypothetical protein